MIAQANTCTMWTNRKQCEHGHVEETVVISFNLREEIEGVSTSIPDRPTRVVRFEISDMDFEEPDVVDLYPVECARQLLDWYSKGFYLLTNPRRVTNLIAYLEKWEQQDRLVIASGRLKRAQEVVSKWQSEVEDAEVELAEPEEAEVLS